MVPLWLHILSIVSLAVAGICAVITALHLRREPQHMWIMNVVWPVSALFASGLDLWAYFRYGRLAADRLMRPAMERGETPPSREDTPYAVMVAKGTLHCGSGCTLGDIVAEWAAFLFPVLAVRLGWMSVFGDKIFAVWILDYILAFGIGIVFQYFTIKPMRDLSVIDGFVQAIKADFLSLTAWQVGMYGFMAVAHFWIFADLIGARLEVASPEFWFMMQIAMLFGFATAYPVNWGLIRAGVKEEM